MNKPKGILTAFISVVLIIATLLTATVLTACDGISDPDSNLSASAVTETPADKFADKSVNSSAEILSRAPTPEPTLTQTGKMPYQSPAPTPDVKHTPNPTPVATRTPDPTPIRTAPPSRQFVEGEYDAYREYMLDLLYGRIESNEVVRYGSNEVVLVHRGDRLYVYDDLVREDITKVVGYSGFIRELPVELLEFANEKAFNLLYETNPRQGPNPDELYYSAVFFDDCLAIDWGIPSFARKYVLIGTDDDWETYYHIKTPEESDNDLPSSCAKLFYISEDGTMFYGTYLGSRGPNVSYSVDRGESWTLFDMELPDTKYLEMFVPGIPVFDGEKGIMPIKPLIFITPWDLEYFMIIVTTEDGGKTWTFSEELSI